MKRLILLPFFVPFIIVHAQNGSFGSRPASESSALGVQEAHPISGKRIDRENPSIIGSPLLSDQFVTGSVQFKSDGKKYNLLVGFSLFDNELYFQKDSTILKFAEPVYEFGLVTNNKNGNGRKVFNFKKNYPEIGDNTNETFYQVVSDGSKFQLLKYLYKTIDERYTYGGPIEKMYVSKEKLFIYDVKNKTIAEINPNISSLEKSMPQYINTIEKFAVQNKIKSENEVSQLIESINNSEIVAIK